MIPYILFIAPALLLMLWAQWRVKSAYRQGMQVPARLSGAAAARYILDQAGLHHIDVHESRGMLSDHYDPREQVLRLSRDVYHERTATSVGIAAHEAGHALQDAEAYAFLVIRNTAMHFANIGAGFFSLLFFMGLLLSLFSPQAGLMTLGFAIACYTMIVFFQIVNLPVEFDASKRARRVLSDYQMVDDIGADAVDDVLDAAAWTYIAATVHVFLNLLYLISIFGNRR